MRMNDNAFNKAISGLKRSETNRRKKVQELALAALETRAEHGDTSRCLALIMAVRGKDQNQVISYLQHFGDCRFIKASNKKPARVKSNGKLESHELQEMLKEAEGTNWYDFSIGQETPEFDPLKDFTDVMAYLQRRAENAKAKGYVDLGNAYMDMVKRFGIDPEEISGRKELRERVDNVIPVNFKKPIERRETQEEDHPHRRSTDEEFKEAK